MFLQIWGYWWFFKFQSKNIQIRSFMSQIWKFCFTWNFAFWKVQGCDSQIWQKFFFTNSSLKHPNKSIFSTIFWGFFVLHEFLHLDRLEGADLNCNNSFFQSYSPKHLNTTFFISNVKCFCFARNIAFLELSTKNTQIRYFQCKIYFFYMSLWTNLILLA